MNLSDLGHFARASLLLSDP